MHDKTAGLTGTVNHVEFLGGIIRYSVAVGADTVLVDDKHRRGARVFAVGDSVELSLQRDQFTVLAE
jgi:iron(III) transport system ATP-binding protein